MKIYLDFDRTLFDTNAFLEEIYHIIDKYNISLEIFNKYKDKVINNGFNCYNILREIGKDFYVNEKIYKEIDDLIKNDSIFIYADVKEFLDYLKSKNYEIILLTKGNKMFQERKIEYSKIKKYFNKIIITLQNKGDLDIDYHAIFIDDNFYELSSIKRNNPLKIIYIDRYKQNNKTDLIKVKSLNEVYSYLE